MTTKTIRYHKSSILGVAPEGLRFLDEQGIETSIDFKTCRKNWVAFVNSAGEFKGRQLMENETHGVGRRDRSGKPPYLELFAEPRVRFEFRESWFDRLFGSNKLAQDFRSLQQAIVAAGWATLDMS